MIDNYRFLQWQATVRPAAGARVIFVCALLSMIACSSSGEDPPAVTAVRYCSPYLRADLASSGGLLSGRLQADLQAGDQLLISDYPDGTLSSFNHLSAEYSYQPPSSGFPDQMLYQHQNSAGRVIAKYRHYWVPEPLRIMPLGDSITSGVEFFDGNDLPAVPERVGYRLALYQQLQKNNISIDFIGQGGQRAGAQAGLADPDNNGYPGVDIGFIHNKLLEILDEGPSDVLLLHIGSNNTPDNAQGIIDILDRVDQWAALNHPVKVLVSTLVPKRDPDKQATVEQFNSDLRARLAADDRANVYLVEQALALGVEHISSEDVGVHPNAAGYLKMAEVWYHALESSGLVVQCGQ